MSSLVVKDLSPFEPHDEDEAEWLGRLQEHIRVSDHVIRLGEAEEREEELIVSRDPYGNWRAGRYIGEIAYQGRRLEIEPRMGPEVIAGWLEGALNLVAVPETAERQPSKSFIALLLAAVWSRGLDQASRHGPPALRRDHHHEGIYVRGGLAVRETARLRGRGSPHVASVIRYRDLDNDVSRTLVAAERVLQQAIGHRRWHTPRVDEVLPQLLAAVGARPRLPAQRDLQRIRYTPITRGFKQLAELSLRIARQEGFGAQSESGEAEGLLLDVAELWELFLLHCVRHAASGMAVEHGTTTSERIHLLVPWDSADTRARAVGMGRLKPDIIVRDGERVVVIDAKYKHLRNWRPERPDGVERSDLYQLAAYLGRLDPDGKGVGMLLYPLDGNEVELSSAEERGPWRTESGSYVRFERIPVTEETAVTKLAALLRDDDEEEE